MTRIVIHVDRLVLSGFAPEDRAAIAAGLQQELARMLAAPGAAERLAGLGNLATLRIDTPSATPAARVGAASIAVQPGAPLPAGATGVGVAAARGIAGRLQR